MNPWRGVLAALGLCLALGAGAVELKEGFDFRTINPPLAAETDKIEVTEFFWYGCSHCFEFEPVLAAWVKKLPPDVSFRRVPALYPNDKWLPGARLYYTLQAMNALERLHGEVFDAIHVERQRLDDRNILQEWLTKKGVEAKQFRETGSSFAVQSHLQQARRLVLAAGVTGVPSLMVQGRYLALKGGSSEELVATVDELIARVRAEGRRK
ncbi:MAG: thiol:disulfide interchange protein DsbA/DsbL [Betaproteobacteria bacterium]